MFDVFGTGLEPQLEPGFASPRSRTADSRTLPLTSRCSLRHGQSVSNNVRLQDFAIFGETKERIDKDQVNGIGCQKHEERRERHF